MTHSPTTSAEKVDLLPCPFCGSSVSIRPIASVGEFPFIEHKLRWPDRVCGMEGFSAFCDLDETEAHLVAKWNTRAALPPTPEPVADKGEGRIETMAQKLYSYTPHIHSEQPADMLAGEWITATWEQLSPDVQNSYRTIAGELLTFAATLPADQGAIAPPDAVEMAAFGASDAACYHYPDANQAEERAAFCAGAAHAVTRLPADQLDAETVGWRDIATFETEPHGQGSPVLIVCGTTVGEAWYRDSEGANDSDSGWWWAGTSPGDYYSSPVSETNELPRLWHPLPAPPAKGPGQGGGE